MGIKERRGFSVICSMKEFYSYVMDEILTAGQGIEKQKYFKSKTGITKVDIKGTNKPHKPELELLFLCMISLFCTIIFKCTFLFTISVPLDISEGIMWINILIVITGALSIGIGVLSKANPLISFSSLRELYMRLVY
ncbi:hypothetical protein NEFER03_0885 [Nematocida sp. LUAm3]|nr:hypothetical protein NEFER03_0885 [Nematocida sp. LUAm3]KAI5174903.1 hypothetical protein NEFER02_1003 [Nematocida sp. LUAm2]KAI5177499.1 hypothetical protein NEFER01_0749 [Nematocida sp. LUAm1]